ncbi:Sad1/UNC-like protein, partial [Microstroma glucosiphilum]
MLSPCPDISGDPQGNFVIVELCDEISIDTIVLANYEFFSRMFKRFRVSASQTLKSGSSSDSENWYQLGIFRARNLRGVQVFNTSLPQTFAAPSRFFRYLRIDFLEYYGNEHYCPLSLLRVYGLTQMDDYRREEEEERR